MNLRTHICDALARNPARFCASISVVSTLDSNSRLPQFSSPSEEYRSGTLTFVKTGGRSFGITCWHVLEVLRRAISESGKQHFLKTMLNGFYTVQDRFIQPDGRFGEKRPDIAIRELSPDFAKALGKDEIDLDNAAVPQNIRIALAVGFPENLKRRLGENDGYRIVMPQCEVASELTLLLDRRFTLFGEVQGEAVEHKEFSGMSGGPIFWSSEDQFGIYGIVYEGGVFPADEKSLAVVVYGEIATPEVIRAWTQPLVPLKFG